MTARGQSEGGGPCYPPPPHERNQHREQGVPLSAPIIPQTGDGRNDDPGATAECLPETERAFLGAWMIDPQMVGPIADHVHPEWFTSTSSRVTFEAMKTLRERGDPVEPMGIIAELQRAGISEEVVSVPSIFALTMDTTSIHAESYAGQLRDAALRRQILREAGKLARLVNSDDPGAALDDFAQHLHELRNAAAGNTKGLPDPLPWDFFTLADAYEERPPVEYVAAGLFALPSLSIVYGPPGCMKSMLLADLALCVATGQPWLYPFAGHSVEAKPTLAAPVVWLDFDNGERATHDRFEAIGRSYNAPGDAPLYYKSMPNPWLNAADSALVDRAAAAILARNAGLVVIDNLGTINGGIDENSPLMSGVMSNLRRLTEITGAAVVVVHHQRKSKGGQARDGDSLRGHSSIEAALDLALRVERGTNAQHNTLTMRATKTRGPDVLPFAATFSYEHKPGTRDLYKARYYGIEVVENAERLTAGERHVISYLSEHDAATVAQITGAANACSERTAKNAVYRLAGSGACERIDDGGQGAAATYSLTQKGVKLSQALP